MASKIDRAKLDRRDDRFDSLRGDDTRICQYIDEDAEGLSQVDANNLFCEAQVRYAF